MKGKLLPMPQFAINMLFPNITHNKQTTLNNNRNIQRNYSLISTPHLNPLRHDTVSFSGKANVSLWEDFIIKFQKAFPGQKIENAIREIVSKPENRLGEGAKKVVFSINGIDDYVAAYLKSKTADSSAIFKEYENPYPGFNFGQPIGGNDTDFIIMKKISGENHGIKNWSAKFNDFAFRDVQPSKEDALFFIKQLKDLAQMPVESYIDLAKQVKYLNDKKIKIDFINPNNAMVDNTNQKITYFDLFDNPTPKLQLIKPEMNCIQDMKGLLTDSMLNTEFVKVLDKSDKENLMNLTKEIAQKCETAGKKVGLSNVDDISYQTLDIIQKSLKQRLGCTPDYVKYYNDYKKLYN